MNLSLKITLTIDFAMLLVGALALFSFILLIAQNFLAMMKSFISLVVGVTLVGGMVPSSVL